MMIGKPFGVRPRSVARQQRDGKSSVRFVHQMNARPLRTGFVHLSRASLGVEALAVGILWVVSGPVVGPWVSFMLGCYFVAAVAAPLASALFGLRVVGFLFKRASFRRVMPVALGLLVAVLGLWLVEAGGLPSGLIPQY